MKKCEFCKSEACTDHKELCDGCYEFLYEAETNRNLPKFWERMGDVWAQYVIDPREKKVYTGEQHF